MFSETEILEVLSIAIKYDLYVLSDETYDFLTYDKALDYSILSLSKGYKKIISVYSFSKEYAMTGWRVGYVCSSEEIINQMLKIHDGSVITAPRISQVAACAALRGSQVSVRQRVEILKSRRNLTLEYLGRLKPYFKFQKPNGSYYIFPEYTFTSAASKNVAHEILDKTGVITIPGSAFGKGGENHLRICFGGEETEIHEAFLRLSEYLSSL